MNEVEYRFKDKTGWKLRGEWDTDKPWWIGFDCAHSGDVKPGSSYERGEWFANYKGIWYVKKECQRLAKQVSEAANNGQI